MMTIRRSVVALAVCLALAIGIFAGHAYARQTHMISARMHLNQALNQLNKATPDKGGHRATAMNLVKQAINEVNLGIAVGR